METSTASEGSSGGAPWTVVTSPRKGPHDDEVTSPAKAAEPAASATPPKGAAETFSQESGPAAGKESHGKAPYSTPIMGAVPSFQDGVSPSA